MDDAEVKEFVREVLAKRKRDREKKSDKDIQCPPKKRLRTTAPPKHENLLSQLEYEKKRFVVFLKAIVPPDSQKGKDYIHQVEETSIEDWSLQMKTAVWPLKRLGFTETLVNMVLSKCGVDKKDIYFHCITGDAGLCLKQEAHTNFLMFCNYLNWFADTCK